MIYERNPYYNPQGFEPPLEPVADIDAFEPDYDFDIFIVVRDPATGKVYVASDSGCSCPIPFEDHNSLADFTEVQSWEDVKREYGSRFQSGYRTVRSVQSIRQRVVGAFRRGS